MLDLNIFQPHKYGEITITTLKAKFQLALLLADLTFIVLAFIITDIRQAHRQAKIIQKLSYLFGQATGSPDNMIRSREMLRLLESIGIYDTIENRHYMVSQIEAAFYDSTNIIRTQLDGRIVKDALLIGKRGALRMETVWQNNKLITIFLKSGGN